MRRNRTDDARVERIPVRLIFEGCPNDTPSLDPKVRRLARALGRLMSSEKERGPPDGD